MTRPSGWSTLQSFQPSKKMSIHIVTLHLHGAPEVLGVFDSIGKADAFAATLPKSDQVNITIETFQVN